ncbi:MAG: hypothetical protein SFV23_07125 [Planctomycetaceae bacterium]|nr:hypothetical protein [Planctomycetaceae bacterium]
MELIGDEDIVPRIETIPTEIPLTGEIAGSQVETTAVIRTLERAGSDHWLTGAATDSPGCSVQLQPFARDEQLSHGAVRRIYRLSVSGRTPADNYGPRCRVSLLQGDKLHDKIREHAAIWVIPERRSQHYASPSVLTVNRLNPAESEVVTRKVLLFGPADTPLDELKVQAPTWIRARLQPPDNARQRLVATAIIEFDRRIPDDAADGEISVRYESLQSDQPNWRIDLHINN